MRFVEVFCGIQTKQLKESAAIGLLLLLPLNLGAAPGKTDASEAQLTVTLGNPALVMVAPDSEKAALWGLYQFPYLWRGTTGNYYLRVNVGQDTHGAIGVQEGGLYFCSKDGLTNWQPVNFDITEPLPAPETRTSSDGNIHVESCLPVSPESLGIDPRFSLLSPNDVGMLDAYRYGDLPVAKRTFSLHVRTEEEGGEEIVAGHVDFPELLCLAVTQSRFSTESEWRDVSPTLRVLVPKEITALPDGSLIGAVYGQSPKAGHYFLATYCVASSDGGRTWNKRGTIADQPEFSTHGYGADELSIAIADNGDLLCALRTDMCSYDTKATVATVLTRSEDQGRTWSRPKAIAPTSVTPHLVQLDNGVIALVHGRPGVHLLFSADQGHTWGNAIRVIGSTLDEVKAKASGGANYIYDIIWGDPETCANTSVVKNGANSFLLAYSDFKHPNDNGDLRKAIKIVEVSVERP